MVKHIFNKFKDSITIIGSWDLEILIDQNEIGSAIIEMNEWIIDRWGDQLATLWMWVKFLGFVGTWRHGRSVSLHCSTPFDCYICMKEAARYSIKSLLNDDATFFQRNKWFHRFYQPIWKLLVNPYECW